MADTNVDPDLEYALEKMRDQRPGYDEAEVFYEGRPQEVFSTAEVKRLLAKSSLDELRNINFSKTAVTAILDLIQVEKVIVTHPDGRPHEEAQQALNALWRYNKLDLELPKLWEKVSVFGDGYLFVWPVFDDDNNIVTVDILVNDPRSVTAVYDEERPRDLDYTLKVWCSNRAKGKEVHEARLYYDDQIRVFRTKAGKSPTAVSSWDHVEDIEHEYGQPIHHFSIPYPDHYWTYTPQLVINKLVIAHVATIDHQGWPQRYGLQDPQLDDTSSQFDADDLDENFDPEDSDNETRLSASPGAFWHLRGYKAVGQFDAANPSAFTAPMDWYVKAMSQTSGTPMDYFDPQLRGQVSGEALKVARAPLISKANDRKDILQAGLKDVFERALELLGFDPDDIVVTILWESTEPDAIRPDPVDQELDRTMKVMAALNELSSAVAVGLLTQQEARTMMLQLQQLVSGETVEKRGITA